MGFVALGQVNLIVLYFSLVSIIPPMLHVHSYIIWEVEIDLIVTTVPQRLFSAHFNNIKALLIQVSYFQVFSQSSFSL
jgi:hypothetical protein